MNEYFTQWLDARLSVPGMLACGIGPAEADTEAVCRSTDPAFSTEKMAEILSLLRNTADAPETEPSALKWRTWVFANAKIRAAIRPDDGLLFAAVVLANSDADQILDPLTEEFLSVKVVAEAAVS